MSSFLNFISVRPAQQFGVFGEDERKLSFVDKSSLTFPVLSVIGATINQVLNRVLSIEPANVWPEVIIALVFGAALVVADFAYNPDSNNTGLKRTLTVFFGVVNAFVLAAAFLGIETAVSGGTGGTPTPTPS